MRGGTETILLVEDDESVRLITRRVLESHGYTIWEATTAREALEVWRSHREEIALLLTDIIMPEGRDGPRPGRAIARKTEPGLKVMFMSGYSAEVVGKDTEFFRRTRSSLPAETLLAGAHSSKPSANAWMRSSRRGHRVSPGLPHPKAAREDTRPAGALAHSCRPRARARLARRSRNG